MSQKSSSQTTKTHGVGGNLLQESYPWSPLERDKTVGLDPSLRKLSIKSSLACCVLKIIWKLGETFETSFSYLSNFVRILGSIIGYVHGIHYPKSRITLCKANLGPLILVRKPRKLIFNSPIPLFCVWYFKHRENLNGFVSINKLRVWD